MSVCKACGFHTATAIDRELVLADTIAKLKAERNELKKRIRLARNLFDRHHEGAQVATCAACQAMQALDLRRPLPKRRGGK